MPAPPLAFLEILVGAILLDKGVPMAQLAFTQTPDTATQPAGADTSGTSSGKLNFSGKITKTFLGDTVSPVNGSGSRLDQGIDGTSTIFRSPFKGKVVKATQSDPGWDGGGYVAIQSLLHPEWVIYLAEGISPTVREGQIVDVGEQVGIPVSNPYNGIRGNYEIGRANPHSPGQPLAQVISNPASMVFQFYSWWRSIGGPAATSTGNAGRA